MHCEVRVFIVIAFNGLALKTRKRTASYTGGLPHVVKNIRQHVRDSGLDLDLGESVWIELESDEERCFLKPLGQVKCDGSGIVHAMTLTQCVLDCHSGCSLPLEQSAIR